MMPETSSCECPPGAYPKMECEDVNGEKHCNKFTGCECHHGSKMVNGDHCQCEKTGQIMTKYGCQEDKHHER
jgi:hypothetical protein